MTSLRRLAIVIALAGATSGCLSPLMSDGPPPVVGDGVNPAPPRGYRVRCTSTPDLLYDVNGVVWAGCRQVLPDPGSRAVIRAKG